MIPEDKQHNEEHAAEHAGENTHKAHKARVEELQKQLDELRAEKDNVFAQLQRVSADYANFQKRSARQIADSIAYEKEKIIKSLLPTLDNFEHALQNIRSSDMPAALVKGVQIVYDHMLDMLRSHGVEQIKAAGRKFDPSLHRAIFTQSAPEQKDNIVLAEQRKGYTLNGHTLRPSEVVVNKIARTEGGQPPEKAEPEAIEDTEE